MNNVKIIFRESGILAVIKPKGIVSESTIDRKGIPDVISDILYPSRNKTIIKTVNRLDKDVSGVMLLAENSQIAGKLIEQIKNDSVNKQYLAVIKGCPAENEGFYDDLLFHDSRNNKTYVVDRIRNGVRKAKLKYKVINTVISDYGKISLLSIDLYTGRTHQIRVQFSSRKMPILGDFKYGSDIKADIALFCSCMSFIHPVSNKKIIVKAYPENVFPWNLFNDFIPEFGKIVIEK